MTKMNKAAIKNMQYKKYKFRSKKQNVKKSKNDKDDNDARQRGDRVQQSEDFNGDPKSYNIPIMTYIKASNKKIGEKPGTIVNA